MALRIAVVFLFVVELLWTVVLMFRVVDRVADVTSGL